MRALETIISIAMMMTLVFASGIDSSDPAGERICIIGCVACMALTAICLKIRSLYYAGEEEE